MKPIWQALRWIVYYALWADWINAERSQWDVWPAARHVLAWAALLAILVAAEIVVVGLCVLVGV